MYHLSLTQADLDAIHFSGGRYGWSETLIDLGVDVGDLQFPEHAIWQWREAVDDDTEGGHAIFPLLDSSSDLYGKLASLYNSIV